jgi:hypothetical protein
LRRGKETGIRLVHTELQITTTNCCTYFNLDTAVSLEDNKSSGKRGRGRGERELERKRPKKGETNTENRDI